jgi:hypothetical protein
VTLLLEEASKELPADAVVVGDEDRRGHVRVILAPPVRRVNLESRRGRRFGSAVATL